MRGELVRISSGGAAKNTVVTGADGVPIERITSIKIAEIVPSGMLRAEISIHVGSLDIYAQGFMSEENMIAAAGHYGYSIKKENSDV